MLERYKKDLQARKNFIIEKNLIEANRIFEYFFGEIDFDYIQDEINDHTFITLIYKINTVIALEYFLTRYIKVAEKEDFICATYDRKIYYVEAYELLKNAIDILLEIEDIYILNDSKYSINKKNKTFYFKEDVMGIADIKSTDLFNSIEYYKIAKNKYRAYAFRLNIKEILYVNVEFLKKNPDILNEFIHMLKDFKVKNFFSFDFLKRIVIGYNLIDDLLPIVSEENKKILHEYAPFYKIESGEGIDFNEIENMSFEELRSIYPRILNIKDNIKDYKAIFEIAAESSFSVYFGRDPFNEINYAMRESRRYPDNKIFFQKPISLSWKPQKYNKNTYRLLNEEEYLKLSVDLNVSGINHNYLSWKSYGITTYETSVYETEDNLDRINYYIEIYQETLDRFTYMIKSFNVKDKLDIKSITDSKIIGSVIDRSKNPDFNIIPQFEQDIMWELLEKTFQDIEDIYSYNLTLDRNPQDPIITPKPLKELPLATIREFSLIPPNLELNTLSEIIDPEIIDQLYYTEYGFQLFIFYMINNQYYSISWPYYFEDNLYLIPSSSLKLRDIDFFRVMYTEGYSEISKAKKYLESGVYDGYLKNLEYSTHEITMNIIPKKLRNQAVRHPLEYSENFHHVLKPIHKKSFIFEENLEKSYDFIRGINPKISKLLKNKVILGSDLYSFSDEMHFLLKEKIHISTKNNFYSKYSGRILCNIMDIPVLNDIDFTGVLSEDETQLTFPEMMDNLESEDSIKALIDQVYLNLHNIEDIDLKVQAKYNLDKILKLYFNPIFIKKDHTWYIFKKNKIKNIVKMKGLL